MAEEVDRSAEKLLEELERNQKGEALARLVYTLAASAFDEGRASLEEGLADAAARLGVDEVSAETSFGNVLRALKKGPQASAPERALVGALLARGVALARMGSPEAKMPDADRRIAECVLFAASSTVADALPVLDILARAPDTGASLGGVFAALGDLIVKHDEGAGSTLSRGSAIVGALALGEATSAPASDARDRLVTTLRDPRLKALLSKRSDAAPSRPIVLVGEVVSKPVHPVVLIALTVTLLLPFVAIAKVIGRYALRLQRPAELRITETGVTVTSRTELLGKTLREGDLHIPRGALSRASRIVRYPRLASYVGIAALLVGSYIGFRIAFDGLKAASPEFLGIGVGVLCLSLAVDYVLARLPTRRKGQCELFLEARTGSSVAMRVGDQALADSALLRLRDAV